jgi:uncharacterized protein YbcI
MLLRFWRFAVFPSSGVRSLQGKARKGRAMATETPVPERQPSSALCSAISTAIVRLMREYTGRGPMTARTTIRRSVVLVMLEQTLTRGEQMLVERGRDENVLALRHEFQEAMRDESTQKVAELTGRDVIAMMSANISSRTLPPRSTFSMDHPSTMKELRQTVLRCEATEVSPRRPGEPRNRL